MISCLVIPIALRTPNSHIESLILAEMDTISQKSPKAKQIKETAALKISSSTILLLMSSMKLVLSKHITASSLIKFIRLFLKIPLSYLVELVFSLIQTLALGTSQEALGDSRNSFRYYCFFSGNRLLIYSIYVLYCPIVTSQLPRRN